MFKILFLEVCLVNCLHNLPLELEPENGALNHCPLFFFKAYFSGDPNGLCLLRTTDSSTRLYGWNRKHALAKSQLTCFIRIANYPFPGVFFFSFLLPSISHNFISSLPPTRTYSYDDLGLLLLLTFMFHWKFHQAEFSFSVV